MKKQQNKQEAKKEYEVSVKIWGKTYTASADSIEKALSSIKIPNAKGRAIVTASFDGKKIEKILMPQIAHRVFNTNGLIKQIVVKKTAQMFI